MYAKIWRCSIVAVGRNADFVEVGEGIWCGGQGACVALCKSQKNL